MMMMKVTWSDGMVVKRRITKEAVLSHIPMYA